MVSPAPGPEQGQESPRPKIKDPLGLLSKWLYLGQIIKTAHHGGELAAAYVIADHANEHGVAWPSQGRIAKLSGLSVRSTRDAVHRLVAAGFVEVIVPGGPGRSTRYRPRLELALEEGSLLKNNTDEEGSLLKRPASPDAEADFSNMRKVASSDPVLPRLQGEGEKREDPCGQGGGPAAAPGLVVEEEEGPDVEAALRRMHLRHLEVVPHKKDPGGTAVFQAVADALQDAVTLEAIEQAHSAWCTGYKRRPNPQHDPSLATWLTQRRWEKVPAKVEPKLTTMANHGQGRPRLVVLVGEDWDPDTCAECARLSDEDRGGSCTVAACPAAALALVDGEPRVDSARCTLCAECWSGCPSQGFSLVARPEALPEAKDGEEYGRQVRSLREALRMGVPTFAEFCGLGGEKAVAILIALEGGAGWAPRAIFDTLEESAGIPLPKTELERRERAAR